MSVSKNTIKKIGHRACFRDMMGQTYPLYPCTNTNHAHVSSYVVHFAVTEARFLKKHLKKNFMGTKSRAHETI